MQAMYYFVQVKVFALVAFFLIASFFIIICIPSVPRDPDWDHSFTMLCTVQTGTWRANLPQRACNVNRKIRESWLVKEEGCAEGTELAWTGPQGWGVQPSLFRPGSVLPSALLCSVLDWFWIYSDGIEGVSKLISAGALSALCCLRAAAEGTDSCLMGNYSASYHGE